VKRLTRRTEELVHRRPVTLIQIKYDPGSWRTRPRRRNYRSGLAEMTTYPIAAFWELAERCGLEPETVQLVPRNTLDRHYAYFFLSKP
jgi:hypothetical protein